MHYHDLFNLTFKPELKDNTLITGWYEFYHDGGLIQGNLKKIGDSFVTIETMFVGTLRLDTLKFIASNPVKL